MSLPDRLPDHEANLPAEAWICAVPTHAIPPTSTADRLSRWESALIAHQARLEAAQVTLATVRDDMRTQRLQNENTRRRLDQRARDLDLETHDLDLKRQKLVGIARRVKELKAQMAAQAQARDERIPTVVDRAQAAESAFDRVPKHLETVDAMPTRSYPADWHTHHPKLGTKVRQGLEDLWDYFTSPVDPNRPKLN